MRLLVLLCMVIAFCAECYSDGNEEAEGFIDRAFFLVGIGPGTTIASIVEKKYGVTFHDGDSGERIACIIAHDGKSPVYIKLVAYGEPIAPIVSRLIVSESAPDGMNCHQTNIIMETLLGFEASFIKKKFGEPSTKSSTEGDFNSCCALSYEWTNKVPLRKELILDETSYIEEIKRVFFLCGSEGIVESIVVDAFSEIIRSE